MKTVFKFFVPMAVAALALSACNKENEKPVVDEGQSIHITVKAKPEAFANAETRTYINDQKTIIWGTGEYMKLAVTAWGEQEGDAQTVFTNSTDDYADEWNGEEEAYFGFNVSIATESSSYTYQGLYPASAAVASSNTNPAAYKVSLPAIQNATANSYDPAAYIMIAQPQDFDEIQDEWMASFRRGTALNKITLKNIPSGVSIKRVKITVPDGKYMAGGRHIDLTTGESGDIYSGGGRTETVEVKFETPLAGGANMDVWFTSWDVEVVAGEDLTIVAYTTNQKSYTKTITVPDNKTIKFQEGYLNTLGANMANITPDDVTELEEGAYVVLAKDGDNYYALQAEKESGKERLLSVSYEGELDSYTGDADIIWNLTKSGDSFIFENDGKYLGYKGSSNESYWLTAGEEWTTTNYLLDVTAQQTAGLYYVTLHSNSAKYLSKNSSGGFFAFYGNTSQKADIVFVPATVDTRAEVSLSFEEPTVSLTPAEAEEYSGQTATAYSDGNEVQGLTITYSWEGDSDFGGLVEGTSEVFLSGETGSATVTATFAGNETYRPATASYTISVSSASGPQYELVSTVNDVVAGDYVITWDNTYYLPSGSTSGTNPAVGTGITVAGNKITNTVTSDMVWTFTGDNTNGFTISDGTNILHSTNAAQGISITTTSTRKWTVSVDGTYGMLLQGDDGGSRYLAVYNNGSWRYYATGNNYTGILRLYKLADNREAAPISWTAATGTATMSASGISSTLPSLTNTNSLAVSYASSDEAVATIANDGTVSILGAGTTTISATYDGSAANAPYKTTTVSYTLTVTDIRTACAAPTFSPAAGEVASGSTVTISSATAGATIYYTTGNSDFSAGDWTEYTAPVAVTAACTIKAIATAANYKNSSVSSAAYTIAAAASTIAQVLAGGAGTYKLNNLLVYSVVGKQVIVGDNTGKMVLFKDGHGLEVGDNISIPSATVDVYNGILQIQDGTFNENSNGNAVDHGTATNLNDATVAASTLSTFSPSGYHTAMFVTLNGTQSGRSINGTNASLYLSAANTTYDGQAVIVTGYIYYYNDTHSNYNFQLVSIEADNTTPTLSVSPASLSWAAAETDSKTLTVTLNGSAAAGDYTYSVTSGNAAAWTISKNNGTLTVAPNAANTDTDNAKSITIRIAHADNNTVYQDVTCSQAKASTGYTLVANQKITFSQSGYSNAQEISSVSGTNWSMSLDKGTNSNAPKYYSSGTAIRCYGGNTFTVTAASGYKIESIKLTFGSSDGSNPITTNIGTYDSGSWTGVIENGGSVTFTVGGTTGNRRLAAIEIN